MTTTTPILEIRDLGFAHAGDPPLAHDWSATIAGGVTLLFGDGGTGKSTLLRVLAGALPARGGTLTLAGLALGADAAAYRRRVFWVDPVTDAFDAVTARACTAALRDGDPGFDDTAWAALAEGFALGEHLDKPMYMLSTGSRRKVWLAAALASGRPLVLLDEPTAALDAASIRVLMTRLAVLAGQRDRAVVLASWARPAAIDLAQVITLPLGTEQA